MTISMGNISLWIFFPKVILHSVKEQSIASECKNFVEGISISYSIWSNLHAQMYTSVFIYMSRSVIVMERAI